MRILEVPPGPVPSEVILTPATLPCNAFIGLAVRLTVNSSGFTLVAEYPKLLDCLLIPKAVTTTSPNFGIASHADTLNELLHLTGTSCVEKPTELNTNTSVPAAVIEKCPGINCNGGGGFSFNCTVTPETGLAVASVTVPVTVCEEAANEKKRIIIKKGQFAQGWSKLPALIFFS